MKYLREFAGYVLLAGICFAILALQGRAQFDNRVTCTVDGKRSFFVSEYSRVGVASEISSKDVPHICGVQGKAVYLVGSPS